MAWRYVARHRFKTAILVLSLALIVFIPVGLRVVVSQSERELTARAERTPLVIGAKGSPLELVLSSLYFSLDAPQTLRFDAVDRVADTGLATPIPLSVRHRSRSDPIVATTLDYFGFRGLRIADGRLLTRLGDCVVGARVARRRGLGPGAVVISSPENFFTTRIQREVGRSNFGAIFVNRQTTGSDRDFRPYNRAYGVDANLQVTENTKLFTYVAGSTDPDGEGGTKSDWSARALANYATNWWNGHIGYTQTGADFAARTGFVPRNGYRKPQARFRRREWM